MALEPPSPGHRCSGGEDGAAQPSSGEDWPMKCLGVLMFPGMLLLHFGNHQYTGFFLSYEFEETVLIYLDIIIR